MKLRAAAAAGPGGVSPSLGAASQPRLHRRQPRTRPPTAAAGPEPRPESQPLLPGELLPANQESKANLWHGEKSVPGKRQNIEKPATGCLARHGFCYRHQEGGQRVQAHKKSGAGALLEAIKNEALMRHIMLAQKLSTM